MSTIKEKFSFKILLLILVVSALFRFYNLTSFQYWSADEEMAAFVVRKVTVDHKLVLTSPNTTTATTLGSFLHLSSAPLFLISNHNPVLVLAFMGLLGIATTALIYKIGLVLKQEKLGQIASFLYASSFIIGLWDRRWWPLSLNPFLAALAVLSLYQIIVNKKYIYSAFLAVSVGFSFHADPSLAVIPFAVVLSSLVFRISPFKKGFIAGLLVLLVFVAPLAVFELRHPGSVVAPLIKAVTKGSGVTAPVAGESTNIFEEIFVIFSRILFPAPSSFADSYIASAYNTKGWILPQLTSAIVALIFLFPLFSHFKEKDKNLKKFLQIIYVYNFTFFASTILFWLSYKAPVHQHYFTVIFPTFILLAAYTIIKLVRKQVVLFFVISAYFLINVNSLITSSFRYPLIDKVNLTKELASQLPDNNFSVFAPGDAYISGGGFTGLFVLDNRHPPKSYIYGAYDWMFKAYSLYTTTPSEDNQKKVVVITDENGYIGDYLFKTQAGNIQGVILDNSKGTFDPKQLAH